jgi:hypothetical protein
VLRLVEDDTAALHIFKTCSERIFRRCGQTESIRSQPRRRLGAVAEKSFGRFRSPDVLKVEFGVEIAEFDRLIVPW